MECRSNFPLRLNDFLLIIEAKNYCENSLQKAGVGEFPLFRATKPQSHGRRLCATELAEEMEKVILPS